MYEVIAKETRQDMLKGGLNVGKADAESTTQPQQSPQQKQQQLPPPSKSLSLPTQPPQQQQQQQSGKGLRFSYYLFEEKERPVEECYDGADKYNSCYFIYKVASSLLFLILLSVPSRSLITFHIIYMNPLHSLFSFTILCPVSPYHSLFPQGR